MRLGIKHRPMYPRGFTRWIQPVEKGYLLVCCDCGLVHEMDFRVAGVRKKRAQFRARRAIGATKQERAAKRRKVKP